MNYRLIATEVGEFYKWDGSVNQIDRMGKAIFPFARDTFPNDSITSKRAKLLYDWILTLAREPMQNDTRNDLLVEFCQRTAPTEELRNRVDRFLASCGIQSKHLPLPAAMPSGNPIGQPKLREKQMDELLERFMAATKLDAQQRGYVLQDILADLFKVEGIEVHESFTRNKGGEQIDGAFRLDGWFYIIECRWRTKLADIRQVDGLGGQVRRSGKQALGVFLSMEGWSPNVPELLKQNPDKAIFLMDGYDLMCILNRQVPLRHFLSKKNSKLTLGTQPFYSASDYRKEFC